MPLLLDHLLGVFDRTGGGGGEDYDENRSYENVLRRKTEDASAAAAAFGQRINSNHCTFYYIELIKILVGVPAHHRK